MKWALPLFAIVLCSCVSAPLQPSVSVPVPAAWQIAIAAPAEATSAEFWGGFGSPALQALMQQAAVANPDLQIAVQHLLIAQDQQKLAKALQTPAVSAGAGPVDSTAVDVGQQRSLAVYRLGLDASYELDFWGRVKNLVASADANTAATGFDIETARLSLQTSVAQQLFDLGEADEMIGLQQQRAALAAERLKLETARWQAGRVDQQNLIAAQHDADQLAAEVSDWQRQRQQHEWQLALLLGQLPESFSVTTGALRQTVQLPVVPAGLPSALLQRRPDVQATAARLKVAQASAGVAWAETFPQIRLTAELGLATDMLQPTHIAPLFGFGPDISWPLLDGGARAAKLDASQREADIAALEYRKAGLAAFADVERALLLRQGLLRQQQQLTKLQQQQQHDHERLDALLQAGRKSRLDVITADEAVCETTQQVIHNYREQLDALLELHAALGGGWHADAAPTTLSLLGRTSP